MLNSFSNIKNKKEQKNLKKNEKIKFHYKKFNTTEYSVN